MKFLKYVGTIAILLIVAIGLASAAPLDVVIEEKINTTVNVIDYDFTGNLTQITYTTNVTGYINITNKASEAIYDIWIAVNLTNNTGDCRLFYNGSSSVVRVSSSATGFVPDKINKAGVFNTTGADCFIHIPLLKPNELVSIFYDVDDTAMGISDGAPFIITERYDPNKIPARGNYTWTVYLNVSLNEAWFGKTAVSLTGNNVSLNITKYLSNQTAHFGSNQWVLLGPISNVNSNKGSTNWWDGPYTAGANDALNVTGISLNTASPNVNITFSVTGNYSNSTAAPYYFEPFGFAVFSFNLTYGNI
ncbi:MAG: hypothetical protein NZ895_05295, partial [Archaeoglobaceae archaeon]|nr:hypothetical protein [Archaeoglobaceae archaeon]